MQETASLRVAIFSLFTITITIRVFHDKSTFLSGFSLSHVKFDNHMDAVTLTLLKKKLHRHIYSHT